MMAADKLQLSYKKITLNVALAVSSEEQTTSREESLGRYKIKLIGTATEEQTTVSLVCNSKLEEHTWSLDVSYRVFDRNSLNETTAAEKRVRLTSHSSETTVLSSNKMQADEIKELAHFDDKLTEDTTAEGEPLQETSVEVPPRETVTVIVRYYVNTSEDASAKWVTSRVFDKPWKNSDVVFVVEDREIHCHSAFLRVHSPVLDKMLGDKKPGELPHQIHLERTKYEPFVVFLNLFYHQNTPFKVSSIETCMEAAVIQHQYQASVGRAVEKALLHKLTQQNALQLLKLGLECELECLQEKALCVCGSLKLSVVEASPVYHTLDVVGQALVLEAIARASDIADTKVKAQPAATSLGLPAPTVMASVPSGFRVTAAPAATGLGLTFGQRH